MQWRPCVVLALALAKAHPCAAGDAPTIRPLEPGGVPTAGDQEPARTLPPSVAICHEPGTARCWTSPLAEDCARQGGRAFRVVLGEADGRDATVALKQCRAVAAWKTPQPPR